MVFLCATTAPGLESILLDEGRQAGLDARASDVHLPGWVALAGTRREDAVRSLAHLRTVHRIGVVLAEGPLDRRDLEGSLTELLREADLGTWLSPDHRLAARCTRVGEHPFSSTEAAAALGTVLTRWVEAAHGRPAVVDLEDPDVLVRLTLDGDDRGSVWVDLVGPRPLFHRGYRSYQHRAAMKGSLAAALVRLSGWDGHGPVLDPMAGGGTMAIEAAWTALEVPPTQLRRATLSAWRTPPFQHARRDRLLPRSRPPDLTGAPSEPRLHLADVHPPHLDGARANLAAAGVASLARFHPVPVDRLAPRVPEARLMVANPPYGMRSASPKEVERVHHHLFALARDRLAPDGVVGLATPLVELVRRTGRSHGFGVVTAPRVHHGRLPIHLIVLQRLETDEPADERTGPHVGSIK